MRKLLPGHFTYLKVSIAAGEELRFTVWKIPNIIKMKFYVIMHKITEFIKFK